MYTKEIKKYFDNTKSEIDKAFNDEKNIVGIIHDTGIYSSLNGIEYAKFIKDKKILFLVSNSTHFANIKNVVEHNGINFKEETKNIKFMTYPNLYNTYVNDQVSNTNKMININADLLILDNYDHINGEKWSLAVNKFISSHNNLKILGIKSSSSNYDNIENIFTNNVVSRVDLSEAVEKKLLSKPIYKSNSEPIKKLIEEITNLINDSNYENDLKENLLNKLTTIINNATIEDDILTKNLNKTGKYIYYCPTKNLDKKDLMLKIAQVKEQILSKYPDRGIEVYISTSTNESSGLQNREAFYNNVDLNGNNVENKIRIMFSFHQYIQSSYVHDLDGIIIDREIKSNKVFNEIIKNTMLKSNNQKHPIIIDLFNNYNHIKILEENYNYKINKKEKFNISMENEEIYFKLKDFKNQLANRFTFKQSYELLLNYYNEFNNIKIPISFKTSDGINYDENGYSLGEWLRKQRTTFSSLSEEKQQLLKNLNIEIKKSFTFDEKFDLLKRYYEINNSLKIPIDYKTSDGINYDENGIDLYSWCQNLKANQNNLSAEELGKLNSINFQFNKVMTHHNSDEIIKMLEVYYAKNNHSNVPSNYKTDDNYNLGRSLEYFRKNKDKLTKEQIDKLDEIGFNLEKKVSIQNWESSYQLLYNYYLTNNNTEVKKGFKTNDGVNYDENGFNLYNWVIKQRPKRSKLTDEQIYSLDLLSFKWNVKNNEIELKELCNEYEISYQDNKDIINKFSKDMLSIKLEFAKNNNLMEKGKLPEILIITDQEIFNKYGVTIEQLFSEYKKKDVK